MIKKIDILRAHINNNDWHKAILLASSFPRLGSDKAVIMQAREALLRPSFQKQLGKDIDLLINNGIKAIDNKYRLPTS